MSLPFRARFSATPTSLRDVRKRARAALAAALTGESEVETALLVFDELASNAIEHGAEYRRGGEALGVSFVLDAGDLLFEFEDADMPFLAVKTLRATFAAGMPDLPDFEDERGRGLFIIMSTLQDIAVHSIADVGMRLSGRLLGVAGA